MENCNIDGKVLINTARNTGGCKRINKNQCFDFFKYKIKIKACKKKSFKSFSRSFEFYGSHRTLLHKTNKTFKHTKPENRFSFPSVNTKQTV